MHVVWVAIVPLLLCYTVAILSVVALYCYYCIVIVLVFLFCNFFLHTAQSAFNKLQNVQIFYKQQQQQQHDMLYYMQSEW